MRFNNLHKTRLRSAKILFPTLLVLIFIFVPKVKNYKFYRTYNIIESIELPQLTTIPYKEKTNFVKISLNIYQSKTSDLILKGQMPYVAGKVNKNLYKDIRKVPENKTVIFFLWWWRR